jgi:hypothetical protein
MYMNALNTQNLSNMSEEAKEHIVVLTELLRDTDLEARMTTLMKADQFLKEKDTNDILLQSIRTELEHELNKTRKMIFMVERAQYLLDL